MALLCFLYFGSVFESERMDPLLIIMDKINVYINSKNRDLHEKISNFTVRIPQNLLRLQQNEYFTLNVNGFYC
jgi:hypothetical protein